MQFVNGLGYICEIVGFFTITVYIAVCNLEGFERGYTRCMYHVVEDVDERFW